MSKMKRMRAGIAILLLLPCVGCFVDFGGDTLNCTNGFCVKTWKTELIDGRFFTDVDAGRGITGEWWSPDLPGAVGGVTSFSTQHTD
jgi:hypothetical protein